MSEPRNAVAPFDPREIAARRLARLCECVEPFIARGLAGLTPDAQAAARAGHQVVLVQCDPFVARLFLEAPEETATVVEVFRASGSELPSELPAAVAEFILCGLNMLPPPARKTLGALEGCDYLALIDVSAPSARGLVARRDRPLSEASVLFDLRPWPVPCEN
jgi:hypothetical protein